MAKKPNVVYILSDDQGAWAMGCAGNPDIHTPNIDRIAENGVLMENFFCVSPVCSPARASLLTGNIPSAHGVQDWLRSGNLDREKFADKETEFVSYVDECRPIEYLKGQVAYTDVLTENGYTCALSGKWHMGDSINPQHGFKYWYTIGLGGCHYYHADMVENGKVTVEDGKYVTDIITDKALTFLDELSSKDDPFYLSVHYTSPHSPWNAEEHPKEYIDMYDGCAFDSLPNVPDHPDATTGKTYGTEKRHEKLRGYFASITAMDANIGRILDALDAKGLTEDTVIIFNGDNGMSMGHHGIWGKGNGTFPLNMYDSSVKVPFVISYPKKLKQNFKCSALTSAYDFFPTLLDVLDIDKTPTQRLPGRSFYKALTGEETERDGEVVVYDEYGPVRMIRTNDYKYIHRYGYGRCELYDLKADPGEEHDLIDSPEHEQIVVDMRRRLEKWFIEYVDPDIDATKENVMGGGQMCRPGIYADRKNKFVWH